MRGSSEGRCGYDFEVFIDLIGSLSNEDVPDDLASLLARDRPPRGCSVSEM